MLCLLIAFSSYIQGVSKKSGICVQGVILGGKMASNKKMEENRPPLEFNFTYWDGFSALYTTCIHLYTPCLKC